MIWWQELIGYIGMLFIVFSFTFKNIFILRLLNSCGSIACMIYGFITNTYATAILNIACLIINLIFMIEDYKNNKCLFSNSTKH